MTERLATEQLPEFGAPPVVEVVLSVQFQPLWRLRPIELAGLRDRWRADYPIVQEQPPLPPEIEGPVGGPAQFQFVVGPAFQTRLWFLNEGQTELLQIQHDRLSVNWRKATGDSTYPRYRHVRNVFEHRFRDLEAFVADNQLGDIGITQAEVSYVNAVDADGDQLGRLDRLLRNWQPPTANHLGEPEQAQAALVLSVGDVGRPPVRMYVAVAVAQDLNGRRFQSLTLTVRGAPGEQTLTSALAFMDQAHSHVVLSFTELTPESAHKQWERRR